MTSGCFSRDETVGSGGIILGKLGHASGDLVLVAQMADTGLSPVGDRLTDNIGRVVLDMPGGDEPFLVEDVGDLVIGEGLGEGAHAVEEGSVGGVSWGGALGSEGAGVATLPGKMDSR